MESRLIGAIVVAGVTVGRRTNTSLFHRAVDLLCCSGCCVRSRVRSDPGSSGDVGEVRAKFEMETADRGPAPGSFRARVGGRDRRATVLKK